MKFTVSKIENGSVHSSSIVFDGHVYRWASSNQVPSIESVESYGIDRLPGFDLRAHNVARDKDVWNFLVEYRKELRAKNKNEAQAAI